MSSEDLLGSWKLETAHNFEPFLKELGINVVLRKVAHTLSPTLTFARSGDIWTMTTVTIVRAVEVKFQLGQEFDERTIDLRNVKTVFQLDEDEDGHPVLIQSQVDSKGVKCVVRRIFRKGQAGGDEHILNQMDVTMKVNSVEASAVFRRIS